MSKQPSCEERIDEHLASTLKDLRRVWNAHNGEEDPEGEYNEDSIYEYGLSFDYVAPGTFADQDEGYWRYQLSWGGPSDEFRFYSSYHSSKPYRIEYRFLDWWDGAHRVLNGPDRDLLDEIWWWFEDIGAVKSEYEKAVA